MILYHGNNKIVPRPDVHISGEPPDFSWGFYTTEDPSQAAMLARREALRDGIPIITRYEYTPDEELFELRFQDVDDRWLDFVTFCRFSEASPVCIHRFDIVSGPMVDETIWNEVGRYMRGELSRELFMALCGSKRPARQTSFHTVGALLTLRYLGYEEV